MISVTMNWMGWDREFGINASAGMVICYPSVDGAIDWWTSPSVKTSAHQFYHPWANCKEERRYSYFLILCWDHCLYKVVLECSAALHTSRRAVQQQQLLIGCVCVSLPPINLQSKDRQTWLSSYDNTFRVLRSTLAENCTGQKSAIVVRGGIVILHHS
jgi:hypothetical protein